MTFYNFILKERRPKKGTPAYERKQLLNKESKIRQDEKKKGMPVRRSGRNVPGSPEETASNAKLPDEKKRRSKSKAPADETTQDSEGPTSDPAEGTFIYSIIFFVSFNFFPNMFFLRFPSSSRLFIIYTA